ncbi:2',3'-cyclic-nucleotide 2'-phosphodiesterase [Tepiditoga spiralis]|uniref:2',3'-cyclic-nucleotide 2'-phosphodiesterase n=1 Tax=Tepiditoga spiralis TaxID=2108365 RepID=A0A7G1G6G9_9BACT|nr:5'-nucleotidase C-terminal domain-containing protein [Tepiditoga spiralis]BBE30724.1 2',3'-cyclic-nucleotide 2'-phosphodiesterase [Tepiditoga spiralis]
MLRKTLVFMLIIISVFVLADVQLQILATSDSHGRFLPYDYAVNSENNAGSLAQVYTVVKKLRAENPNTILIDVGDTIQDNSASLFINDAVNPMMLALNEIGYDVWVLGNHEFNYGIPALEKVMKQFKHPENLLGGNVYKPDGTRLAKPYTIIEKDGIKVGIIGMVTPNIKKWDASNLANYKVTNPIDETREAIKELKGKVDIIIATEHMALDDEYDVKGSGALDVIAANPEINVFVAAHAHVKIANEYYYKGKLYKENELTDEIKNNGTLIVEPYKWGRTISQVLINFKKENGKYVVESRSSKNIDMKAKHGNEVEVVPADKTLETELQPYNERAISYAEKVFGEMKGGNLVPDNTIKGSCIAKLQPNAMIDLINKTQMKYGERIAGRKIDVASAAVFREDSNIKEGKIANSDMALIYKYDNTLYVLEIKGKQLKEYMEWSAAYYNQFKDGDLTISFNPDIRGYNYDMFNGVKYEIDISKPAGHRIVNLRKMDGTPIKDTDVLTLAVNNYRANSQLLKPGAIFKDGEDLPKLLGKSTDVPEFVDGRIRDLLRKYIKEELNGVLTPKYDNNWKIIGYKWDPKYRAAAIKLINEGKINLIAAGRSSSNSVSVTKKDVDALTSSYMIKEGDTLSSIAKKVGSNYMYLAELNGISAPYVIHVYDELLIPKK